MCTGNKSEGENWKRNLLQKWKREWDAKVHMELEMKEKARSGREWETDLEVMAAMTLDAKVKARLWVDTVIRKHKAKRLLKVKASVKTRIQAQEEAELEAQAAIKLDPKVEATTEDESGNEVDAKVKRK